MKRVLFFLFKVIKLSFELSRLSELFKDIPEVKTTSEELKNKCYAVRIQGRSLEWMCFENEDRTEGLPVVTGHFHLFCQKIFN